MDVPFVLTVAVEENAFDFFNALRKIYFPQGSSMDTHLKLFHLLPNDPSIIETIENITRQHQPLLLRVYQPLLLDHKVVYTIESAELIQLHENLQQQWKTFLIPQDREKLWPHITIQEKATEEEAKELLHFLNENFSTFHVKATGLQLWEYSGGQAKLFRPFQFTTSS